MLRWTKWIAPVAGLVLLAGLQQANGDDATTKPEGKAKITVTVVDDAGKPVSGATVMLMAGGGGKKAKGGEPTTQPDAAPAGKHRAAPLQTAENPTGDDGTTTLEKVPDGTYQVAARLQGKGNGRAKVVIAEGKDEAVSITIKAKAK